jgi:hypothetical protein
VPQVGQEVDEGVGGGPGQVSELSEGKVRVVVGARFVQHRTASIPEYSWRRCVGTGNIIGTSCCCARLIHGRACCPSRLLEPVYFDR